MTAAEHPNATDPVNDPAYPGIVAADELDDDVAQPPADGSWDTDPDLTPTLRVAGTVVLEPDDAWAALCAHDEVHRP